MIYYLVRFACISTHEADSGESAVLVQRTAQAWQGKKAKHVSAFPARERIRVIAVPVVRDDSECPIPSERKTGYLQHEGQGDVI